MLPIIAVSTGNSWAAQNWEVVRRMWEQYAPGTTLDIVEKDLRSVASAATRIHLRLPVSATALEALHGAWRTPGSSRP